MQLDELIADPASRIEPIAQYLDALDDAGRRASVGRLERAAQRALYRKAADAPPLGLEYFVGDAPPRVEVIHEGRNTLPVPGPFRRFQKRFCRPAGGGEARLFGYNEGITRGPIGPGFFVAVSTVDRPEWAARGGVVIDYHRVPDGPVAPGWPAVVPNDWRLQRFVYHRTRDFMRRVSAHVSIGAAYKDERALDHYFVLCRRG